MQNHHHTKNTDSLKLRFKKTEKVPLGNGQYSLFQTGFKQEKNGGNSAKNAEIPLKREGIQQKNAEIPLKREGIHQKMLKSP